MRWEKVAVPFRVSVSKEFTFQNIRNQLRSLPQYTWIGWDDAAKYCLESKVNSEECLRWSDRSVQIEERFDNLMTRSQALAALGRTEDAAAAKTKALEKANASQLYGYGRQLQFQKKPAEALEVFRNVSKRFPDHWLGHVAQARVLSAVGDFPNAVKEVNASLAAGALESQKPTLQNMIKRLEAKQDINQ
jgi:tetratricopeptide (TPR) repeat protein